jgi:type II secretion system protein G
MESEVKNMLNSIRNRRSAFTLIELLVVMVVLVIIAAIAIPKMYARGEQSKESALHSDLALVRNAIASFQADTGYYPLKLTDLTVLTSATLSTANTGVDSTGAHQTIVATNFHGPYLQSLPTDPVSGNAFTYSVASPTVGNVTSSAAGNGLDGTAFSTW